LECHSKLSNGYRAAPDPQKSKAVTTATGGWRMEDGSWRSREELERIGMRIGMPLRTTTTPSIYWLMLMPKLMMLRLCLHIEW